MTKHLSILSSLLLLVACDPCEVRIVQAAAGIGSVRVWNDCPNDQNWSNLILCAGQGGTYDTCIDMDVDIVNDGGCVDVNIDLSGMMQPAAGASLAVFSDDQDPATDTPVDQVGWGSQGLYKSPSGGIAAPAAPSLTAAKFLTMGEEGWYDVDSGPVHTQCAAWDHVIHPATNACLPQLVEVKPGTDAYFKVAFPTWCAAKKMDEFVLAWGSTGLDNLLELPVEKLAGGDCITIGGPGSSPDNGFAQWVWDMLHPTDLNEIHPVEAGADGVPAMAALLWNGEANGGVVWGRSGVSWPNLDEFPVPVPAGRAIRWTGSLWENAPPAPNLCPRWRAPK